MILIISEKEIKYISHKVTLILLTTTIVNIITIFITITYGFSLIMYAVINFILSSLNNFQSSSSTITYILKICYKKISQTLD